MPCCKPLGQQWAYSIELVLGLLFIVTHITSGYVISTIGWQHDATPCCKDSEVSNVDSLLLPSGNASLPI